MADAKRGADAANGGPAAKVARLGEDRVAAMPVGANYIEIDGKSCTHEVCWPPGVEGSLLPPPKRDGPPAREYPFAIDPFQQTAINCLEAGHSVLVAAHTSAGKTVVAEYAFAMALRQRARVIYTSPLKALSNQKFRELRDEFGDVGLMTGDVTIDAGASCLVMTTEILRSMLLRGSEITAEVSLVVYDEVHYLRDPERGVVWEESLVLMPKQARLAFLSATLPNSAEFASWVAATHGAPVHVVYTEYRPTPLQHYIFPSGAAGLYMVVDERGAFREDNFQQAVAALADAQADGGKAAADKRRKQQQQQQGANGSSGSGVITASNGTGAGGAKSDVARLVSMVMRLNYDPLIVFSFSKRECEALAGSLGHLDLNTPDEAALVDAIFRNAVDLLSEADQRLPQVTHMLPALRRGVGVHHSGQLPILKEVVELLFQDNLIKVLFATETFSTGLNMPAKTVAFARARKYDGGAFRWLSSGEYIQMSGRAGRRGLDDRGIVLLMLDAKMEPAVAKEMIKGSADPLMSAFQLRYSSLLALERVPDASAEQLILGSFRQWQLQRAAPALDAAAAAAKAAVDAVVIEDEAQVKEVLEALEARAALCAELRAACCSHAAALPFLQPGRLVRVARAAPDPKAPLPAIGEPTVAPPPPARDGGATASGSGSSATVTSGAAGGALADVMRSLDDADAAWGILVSFEKGRKAAKKAASAKSGGREADDDDDDYDDDGGGGGKGSKKVDDGGYVVDVLVNVDPSTVPALGGAAPPGGRRALPALLPPGSSGAGSAPVVVSFPLACVAALSSLRLKALKDLRAPEARAFALAGAAEVLRRYGGASGKKALPLLDAVDDLRLDPQTTRKLVSKLEALDARLSRHPLAASPDLAARLATLQRKRVLQLAARDAKRRAKEARGMVLADELEGRRRVLRRLGFVGGDGVVKTKGRVAAELSTGSDELVLSELLLNGAFNDLAPPEVAALASCFVWTEKGKPGGGARLTPELQAPYNALRDAAKRVAAASKESGLSGDVDTYVDGFRPELMQAVAAWARGVRFADVLKMVDVYEGSLVRAVRRLEELMRQAGAALRGVGEVGLADKFDDACARVRRDVVFAASLYL